MNARNAIASQYYAALDMLKQAIVACPAALWNDRRNTNMFWHIAYHTLYYTHLYLQPSRQHFTPWAKRRGEHESLRRIPLPSDETQKGDEPYTRQEILEYLAFCWQQVEEQVASMTFDAPSGFHWLPFDKLELQFYNIRHIQQHTGELYERLSAVGGIEVGWVAMRPVDTGEYP
jgi:hypothetical protein